MSYLTKQQLYNLADQYKITEPADLDKLAEGLMAKGHSIEGINDTATNAIKYGVKLPSAKSFGEALKQNVVGAAKGLGHTLNEMGKTASAIPNALSDVATGAVFGKEKVAQVRANRQLAETKITNALEARTKAELVGKNVEQIAEYLAPTGIVKEAQTGIEGVKLGAKAVSKIPSIVRALAPTAKLAAKSAVEGLATFGVAKAQGNTNKEALKIGAMGAGATAAFGVAGAAFNKFAKATGFAGKKILNTAIKPTAADMKDGFSIENVIKHDVGGDVGQVVSKATDKMRNLTEQLKTKIGSSSVKLDIKKIADEVEQELASNKAKTFGTNLSMNKAIQTLRAEIAAVTKKPVDLTTAQILKQEAGAQGAWKFGMVDPEAKASEVVYNAFYRKIKEAIEKASPSGVREINKALSELIPIRNAAIRRLPVEMRNQAVSLTDALGLVGSLSSGNIAPLALTGMSRLQRSGKAGAYLVKAGKSMEKLSSVTPREAISATGSKVATGLKKNLAGKQIGQGIKDVNKMSASELKAAGLSKELQPLAQEARKYKSAEEFVKAQGETVYHGTNYKEFDPTKAVSKDGLYGKGVYFASDKNITKQYGNKTVEAYLDKGSLLKIDQPLTATQKASLQKVMGGDEWDWSKNPTGEFVWNRLELTKKNPEELLKKAGIKGIQHKQFTSTGENINYTIFDDSAIKTKSQLTDIYNQATKGTSSISQAKVSGQSFDEWVKGQGEIHRGDTTPIKLSEMDTAKVFNPAEKEALSAFNNTPGLYFTDSVSNAKSYGQNLTSVSVSPTAKVINVNDAPKILKRADVEKIIRSNPRIKDWATNWDENFDKAIKNITDSVMAEKDGNEFLKAIWSDGGFSAGDFVNAMKKAGIDGITVPKEGVSHFVIYNKDVLKTRSQLKAEWDKVAGKADDITTSIKSAKQSGQYGSAIEAMESPDMKSKWAKINATKGGYVTKTSNNLYHTTSVENLESIRKNGLTTGNKARFEGVSSPNKISFGANEATASYYGKNGDIMIRTKTSYKPTDLQEDLLAGGKGTYTTSKNIPPEMLEVKINGKWQPLVKTK